MILQTKSLCKIHTLNTIFNNVSFTVEEGDKIGLIGRNGSGKTTLMEILSGEQSPDGGEIIASKNLSVGYLTQHSEFTQATLYEETATVFKYLDEMEEQLVALEGRMAAASSEEEVLELSHQYQNLLEKFEERGGYQRDSRISGTLLGLGFSREEFSMDPRDLSGGQQSRLNLAKLLLTQPTLLLLDEPTNHLDVDAISWLEKFLQDYRGTLMVISHDRYFLDHVVGRIFLLESGEVLSYTGNYSTFLRQRKKELEVQHRSFVHQQREIKRQEEIIERYKSWNRERSVKAARSREKQLAKVERLEDVTQQQSMKLRFEPKKESGKDVLILEEGAKSFGEKTLFENASMALYRGEHVGLIGPNGIGKSTLLKAISGREELTRGKISLGSHVSLGYYDQQLSDLDDHHTVLEELWDSYPQLTVREVYTHLASFLFTGDATERKVGELSGGEKGRLSLLKVMLSGANFLLFDEPTNHLDIPSKELLEEALEHYPGTLLTVSHDRYFLNKICHRTLALSPQGIQSYEGNYDYYLEKTQREEEPREEEKSRTEQKKEQKKSRAARQEAKRQRAQLQALEEKIHQLEEQIQKIDRDLSLPETYEDHKKALALSEERGEIQATLDEVYEDWLLATEALED
ncbi:MAG: ABC-F family ATP-binding cassette domain-containing protein [Tissierellia bacterium]|nr:ABC-F family ATP-binding cassette domain-containing protein [Tissierellia bacterium]